MATQADIDALSDKLSTTEPLSWIIADCPVVALFDNNSTDNLQSLGQPLDRNSCGDLLRLWVGINEKTRELLLTLTIRIRVSPVRKKTRRQGRLMFMVVPSNTLQLRTAVVDYNDLGNKLSQHLFDMPTDTQSAMSKLLHLSFDTGTYMSDVIMPAFQCRSNVMPQAMSLLRKLKSLSETSSFQLYTNLEESRQIAAQHVSNILLERHPMITPSIDIRGFYPGGRSACKNMWANQGWLEAEIKEAPGTDSDVEKNQKELHISFSPQPPPPYEPKSVPNHVSTSPDRREVLSSPRTKVSVSEHGLPATESPSNSSHARSASHHQSRQLRADKLGPAPTETAQVSARARDHSPSTPRKTLSSGYTATFLSGFPDQSPLAQIRDRAEAQSRAVATGISCPSVQVIASSVDERVSNSDDASTHANTPNDILDRVPDSLNRKRLATYSLEAGTSETVKRLALSRQSHQPPLLNVLHAGFSPTIPDTVSYHNGDTAQPTIENSIATDQSDRLTQWLNHAWRYCPTAHYLFVTELLRYGSVLSSDHSQDDVTICHVSCTLALVAHCTKRMLAEDSNRVSADCEVDVETRALVRWLYMLRPGADMELFPSLLRLSILSQQSLLVSHTNEEHDALTASSKRQQAEIVSQACMKYGAELLQRNPSNLVSKMLREEERVDM